MTTNDLMPVLCPTNVDLEGSNNFKAGLWCFQKFPIVYSNWNKCYLRITKPPFLKFILFDENVEGNFNKFITIIVHRCFSPHKYF